MVERQRAINGVFPGDPRRAAEVDGLGGQLRVGARDELRAARGARRVEVDGDVAGGAEGGRLDRGGVERGEIVVGPGGARLGDDARLLSGRRERASALADHRVDRYERSGVGAPDVELELLLRVGGVQREGYR